jgi:hypothetical protein
MIKSKEQTQTCSKKWLLEKLDLSILETIIFNKKKQYLVGLTIKEKCELACEVLIDLAKKLNNSSSFKFSKNMENYLQILDLQLIMFGVPLSEIKKLQPWERCELLSLFLQDITLCLKEKEKENEKKNHLPLAPVPPDVSPLPTVEKMNSLHALKATDKMDVQDTDELVLPLRTVTFKDEEISTKVEHPQFPTISKVYPIKAHVEELRDFLNEPNVRIYEVGGGGDCLYYVLAAALDREMLEIREMNVLGLYKNKDTILYEPSIGEYTLFMNSYIHLEEKISENLAKITDRALKLHWEKTRDKIAEKEAKFKLYTPSIFSTIKPSSLLDELKEYLNEKRKVFCSLGELYRAANNEQDAITFQENLYVFMRPFFNIDDTLIERHKKAGVWASNSIIQFIPDNLSVTLVLFYFNGGVWTFQIMEPHERSGKNIILIYHDGGIHFQLITLGTKKLFDQSELPEVIRSRFVS